MKEDDLKVCGNCCWFRYEDSDWWWNWGICAKQSECGSLQRANLCTTGKYTSRKEARHHVAVLIQANRYRRDRHVPAIYRMPRPVELGRAIDFAVKYIKTHTNK